MMYSVLILVGMVCACGAKCGHIVASQRVASWINRELEGELHEQARK